MKVYIDRFVLTIERGETKANLNLSLYSSEQLDTDSLIHAVESYKLGLVRGGVNPTQVEDFLVFSLGEVFYISRIYPFDVLSYTCQECGSDELFTRFPKPYCKAHAVVDFDLMQRVLDAVHS